MEGNRKTRIIRLLSSAGAVLAMFVLVFALSACGGSASEGNGSAASSDAPTEEDVAGDMQPEGTMDEEETEEPTSSKFSATVTPNGVEPIQAGDGSVGMYRVKFTAKNTGSETIPAMRPIYNLTITTTNKYDEEVEEDEGSEPLPVYGIYAAYKESNEVWGCTILNGAFQPFVGTSGGNGRSEDIQQFDEYLYNLAPGESRDYYVSLGSYSVDQNENFNLECIGIEYVDYGETIDNGAEDMTLLPPDDASGQLVFSTDYGDHYHAFGYSGDVENKSDLYWDHGTAVFFIDEHDGDAYYVEQSLDPMAPGKTYSFQDVVKFDDSRVTPFNSADNVGNTNDDGIIYPTNSDGSQLVAVWAVASKTAD